MLRCLSRMSVPALASASTSAAALATAAPASAASHKKPAAKAPKPWVEPVVAWNDADRSAPFVDRCVCVCVRVMGGRPCQWTVCFSSDIAAPTIGFHWGEQFVPTVARFQAGSHLCMGCCPV